MIGNIFIPLLLPKNMKRFDQIIKDIKEVKTQGAESIALAGMQAFLLQNDKTSVDEILKTRSTEPMMQNLIRFLQKSKNPRQTAQKLKKYIKQADKQIAIKSSSLVEKNLNIFSHCHSTTVMRILKHAYKKQKKNFVVYTTEVEPLLQGRKTAEELANAGIKVIVFPDLAAEQAIKKCDIFLFGVDAFSKKGLANKIGTSAFCKLAKEFNIPRVACTISLKYTNKIVLEQRPSKEVWDERHKKIEVINPAFDFVDSRLITAVASEFGILPYGLFVKQARENLRKLI